MSDKAATIFCDLKSISGFITKGATPTTYGFIWERSGIPFLRSECVSPHGLDMRQAMFISPEADAVLSRSRVRDGDILMTITGNVGRVVRMAHLGVANINQHIARVRITDQTFDADFIFHFLSQPRIRAHYETITTGQAYPQISLTQVRSTRVPVLPLLKQREIASALSAADDLIESFERLIAKKQAIKQGMVQQLLTGQTRLPGFGGTWRDVTLDDVAAFSKGAGLPKSEIAVGGSAPCVHYGELFTNYGVEIDDVMSYTDRSDLPVRSRALDVLMPTSDVTPRGLAKASAILASGVILGGDILIIRPEENSLYGPFLAHVIRNDASQVLQLVRGSTVFHLYASDMKNFSFRVPTTDEQKAICGVLRDADAELSLLEARLNKSKGFKQGMMQELLTGRTRLSTTEVAA